MFDYVYFMWIGEKCDAITKGGSNDPFDRWFRERVKEIHGVDLAEASPLPPPEHVLSNHVM